MSTGQTSNTNANDLPGPLWQLVAVVPTANDQHPARFRVIELPTLPDEHALHAIAGAAGVGTYAIPLFYVNVATATTSGHAPSLRLDPLRRRVQCGRRVFSLPPVDFAFLAWFARRALDAAPGLCRGRISDADRDAFLAEYDALHGEMDGEPERVHATVRAGLKVDYFDYRKSYLRNRLVAALGAADAQPYLIARIGRRPLSRYALTLKPESISFGPISE